MSIHAFTQDGDSRSFVRSHQGWFLQQFGKVPVDSGIPADNALHRHAVDLGIVGGAREAAPACPRATETGVCGWVIARVLRVSAAVGSVAVGWLSTHRPAKHACNLPPR